MKDNKNRVRKLIMIFVWLALWQLIAGVVKNEILLVGPAQVIIALLRNCFRTDFLITVASSLLRILIGFFVAFFAGIVLGTISYRYSCLEDFLSPLFVAIKSVPVASFVVLLLIWFGSEWLSLYISFLIALPNVYVNVLSGLKSTDKKLLEMAQIYNISAYNRYMYIYRTALMPYLNSSLKVTVGMCFKSGAAAEVIGLPAKSLGERLYMAKIYLETADLFAWTIVIILLSYACEKLILKLIDLYAEYKPYPYGVTIGLGQHDVENIRLEKISKSYNGRIVLDEEDIDLQKGERYCLMAPSGTGKTTLLRIMSGLETDDAGRMVNINSAYVFQEDRLLEEYSAIHNVMLVINSMDSENISSKKQTVNQRASYVRDELLKILDISSIDKPVAQLSGGQRRRVQIVMAMLSDKPYIFMDEAFSGLDEDNKKSVADYINSRLNGRTLLFTTHDEEDVKLLEAQRIYLREVR